MSRFTSLRTVVTHGRRIGGMWVESRPRRLRPCGPVRSCGPVPFAGTVRKLCTSEAIMFLLFQDVCLVVPISPPFAPGLHWGTSRTRTVTAQRTGSQGFGNLRTANWRTSNMRTNMRTRSLIGRDVTRVPRVVRKVPHGVRSSHCFVSRPNEPYCSIAESRCICIFMTTVFWQLFVSVT